ncbi:MAG TPA: FHA domain-containing protein [Ktedonobacterales bacterium]
MSTAKPTAGAPSITFLSGSLQGRILPLAPVTTIGSDPGNDIVVRDAGVAPRHIRLVKGDAAWRLEKLAPSERVAVDDRETSWSTLRDNAVVSLGAHVSFRFTLSAPTPATSPATPIVTPNVTPVATPVVKPVALPARPQPAPATPAINTSRKPSLPPTGDTGPRSDALGRAGPNETEIADLAAPAGIPYLEVRNGRERKIYPLAGPTIDIGRDGANTIVLDERVVSARHLRLTREGNTYVLIHPHPDRARTLNGLLYHGEQIAGDGQFRKALANGDVFRIGTEQTGLVTLTYYDGVSPAEHAGEIAPMEPIKLGEAQLSIGRRPDNRIVLPHQQVSALHALLVREGGTYRILDRHSTNGVYVNGERQTDYLLELGDEIRIGPYRFVYEANQLARYDESKFIGIQAVDLYKTGTNEIILLDDISLCVPPRAFVAVVGGSGAGKSTLLDALNGLRPAQGGSVAYNGQDLYANRAAFRTQMGYVPQDDIVHKDLTVERALYYAAKLRLPSDFTEQLIAQRISEVLDDVEMSARRHLLVKKLSGGQRKRVSIALELLANPSLFFLDEPTSGLDPGLDRKMMYLLRRLADKGHTIVLVTHATSNINVCDFVCFLGQGGRLVYFGPPDEARTFFGKSDFAEIYASLEPTDANPNVPAEAQARFRGSQAYQEYIAKPLDAAAAASVSVIARRDGVAGGNRAAPSRDTVGARQASPAPARKAKPAKRGNPFSQFALLTRRRIELLRNDSTTLVLLALQAPVMTLLVMLLIHFGVGTGLFDQQNVVQCAPQIPQAVVTVAPTADNPSGAVRLGIDTSKSANPEAPVDCRKIEALLRGEASAQASEMTRKLAQDYVQHKAGGDVIRALQDWIVYGDSGHTVMTIFLMGFIAVLIGAINGTREIVKEATIYRRERAVNLGILPYIGSKIAVLGTFAVLQSAIIVLIVELFEPLRSSVFLPVLLEVFITIVLTALASVMFGLALSTVAGNEDSANSLVPFILIPQVIFSGALFPLQYGVLQVVAMLTPMRWATVALGTTVGLHSDKLGQDALLSDNTAYHGTLLSTFTQQDGTHWLLLTWGALAAMIVVLVVVSCVGLRLKDVGGRPGGGDRRNRRSGPLGTRSPRPLAQPVTASQAAGPAPRESRE